MGNLPAPPSEDGKQEDKNRKNAKRSSVKPKKKSFFSLVKWKWIVTVFFSSLSISVVLSILSSEIVDYLSVLLSLIVLFFFVILGVVFDIIGLAVSTADAAPFHSMAAQKVKAGRVAVNLIKNAEKVSSFCNDVIGDICGVVSGSTAAAIAIKIATGENSLILLNLLICGVVSALTVGLKAIGKVAGFHYNRQIVTAASTVLGIFVRTKKPKKGKSQKVKS